MQFQKTQSMAQRENLSSRNFSETNSLTGPSVVLVGNEVFKRFREKQVHIYMKIVGGRGREGDFFVISSFGQGVRRDRQD